MDHSNAHAHPHSDESSDDEYHGMADEMETETYFWGENVAANGKEELTIAMMERIHIQSIALSGKKKTETTVSLEIPGETFVLFSLSQSCPQFRVDLQFGYSESPVVIKVDGDSSVSLVGKRELVIVEDEDEIEGMEGMEGLVGFEGFEGMEQGSDSEEEEVKGKPQQNGKAHKDDTKAHSKVDTKAHDSKAQPKVDTKAQPKADTKAHAQPKADTKAHAQPKVDTKAHDSKAQPKKNEEKPAEHKADSNPTESNKKKKHHKKAAATTDKATTDKATTPATTPAKEQGEKKRPATVGGEPSSKKQKA